MCQYRVIKPVHHSLARPRGQTETSKPDEKRGNVNRAAQGVRERRGAVHVDQEQLGITGDSSRSLQRVTAHVVMVGLQRLDNLREQVYNRAMQTPPSASSVYDRESPRTILPSGRS